MTDHGEMIRRLVDLIHTCVPAENLGQAVVPAVACVAAGGLLLFWGARVIRTILFLACVTGGGYVGWLGAHYLGKPPALGIIIGAAVVGILGLVLSRLLVAGLSGALAAIVALSVFGYHEDLPGRFERFAATYRQPAPTPHNEFPLGEPGSAEAVGAQRTAQVLLRFVDHLKQSDEAVLRNLLLCVASATLVGTILGSVAHRWAMIFWTSLAGLVLSGGGGAILLTNVWPKWHEHVTEQAPAVGAVVALVWLLGMVVQWRGTRRIVVPLARPADAGALAKAG